MATLRKRPIHPDAGAMTPERVRRHLQSRFNPIRNLTPQSLSTMLDSYSAGYLREFAIAADKIEERDDVLKSVVPKRKKAVARHGWEICTVDDSPKAKRHKEVLEDFYNNLECTHALNRNHRGSFKLLVYQMMDAIAKGLAVHEIVWKPATTISRSRRKDALPSATGTISAELIFTPIWFFENTTGRLRFLQDDYSQYGVDLEPGGWLVTAADPLMPASAVAWMFKNLSLKDWVTYCERHGMPGIRGVTNAARGSAEWNAMVDAVTNFASDFAAVMSDAERIEAIDMKGSGELPYPGLVERMDRAMATIWRGSDLGTISQGGESSGASLQGDETDLLEEADAELISETLNMQLDPLVIQYYFEGAEPLAYIRIPIPAKEDTAKDIQVDTFLTSHGVRLSKSATLERYGRAEAETEEDALQPSSPSIQPTQSIEDRRQRSETREQQDELANEQAQAAADAQAVQAAIQADMRLVVERYQSILEIEDADLRRQKLETFLAELPSLLKDISKDPALAGVIEKMLARGFANGLEQAKKNPNATPETAQ